MNASSAPTIPASASAREWPDAWRLGSVALAYLAAHKLACFVPETAGVIVAIWPANGISALAGASAAVGQSDGAFWRTYRTWWIADGLGLLLVTPLIVSRFRKNDSVAGRPVGCGSEGTDFKSRCSVVRTKLWLYFNAIPTALTP